MSETDVIRVLLVEDTEHDAIALNRALGKSGSRCEVTTCRRAEEALDMLISAPAEKFHVAVMDHGLSGMSGLDFCRKFVESGLSLPLIILTGIGSERMAVDVFKAGAADYIVKDPAQIYLELLPVTIARVFKAHKDILARQSVEAALKESEANYSALVEQAHDGVIIVQDETVKFANRAVSEACGYSIEELLGMPLFKYVAPESVQKVKKYHLMRLRGEPVPHVYEISVFCKKGDIKEAEVSAAIIQYEGRPAVMGILRDITERKRTLAELRKSLAEKELLMREIHHRVKNNFQIISSLLMLQSDYVKDPHYMAMLYDSRNRIKSMALVHEKLYQAKDVSRVDFKSYIDTLARELFNSSVDFKGRVILKLDVDEVALPIDIAVPCGLVINELLTNAIKHAFPDGRRGSVGISLHKNSDTVELEIFDDGAGIEPGMDIREGGTLGLKLVTSIVENQLGGSIAVDLKNGTRFSLRFTAPEPDAPHLPVEPSIPDAPRI
jgi:PAS domain S-box-containing protein